MTEKSSVRLLRIAANECYDATHVPDAAQLLQQHTPPIPAVVQQHDRHRNWRIRQ